MRYRPQLAKLVKSVPRGDGWLHEMEYDGHRIGAEVDGRHVRLLGRRGEDWTARCPQVVMALGSLGVRALLDGELAALDDTGRTSLELLQDAFGNGRRPRLVYFVFDIIALDGEDLTRWPLLERKALLEDVLARDTSSLLLYATHVVGGGDDVFRAACAAGLEGIVSKRTDSPYMAGTKGSWVKTECIHRPAAPAPAVDSAAAPRGIRISHPDRVLYPRIPLTKLELAKYYEAIAEWMVPHVIGRPLTLLRCERDIDHCEFMRHGKAWGPSELRRVRIEEKTKTGEYLVADTAAALIALVQMDVVEVHTWNTDAADVERPNRLVFDLDPGPRVPWRRVVEAARMLRAVLSSLQLESWVKTTGGVGLHVVVPLEPRLDWKDCFAFSRSVCEAIERQHPKSYTTAMPKAGRENKILLDYYRNNRTNTSVAAFSSRAKPNATVSAPVAWDELDTCRADHFTVKSLPSRRKDGGDAWVAYWTTRQQIETHARTALSQLVPWRQSAPTRQNATTTRSRARGRPHESGSA